MGEIRHRAGVLWMTGLSGSGKTTLANSVENELATNGVRSFILDGDRLRQGLNSDLGFSDEDRQENVRRTGEVAALLADAGLLVIVACISPFASGRAAVSERVGRQRFIEAFVDAPIEVCRERDPKGLYAKAAQGLLPNFTGIDSLYERPPAPRIHLRTDIMSLKQSVAAVLHCLTVEGWIRTKADTAP